MANKGWLKLKKILRDKIVGHHIVYAYNGTGNHKQTDVEVPIYYMEHHILTALQRRGSRISRGFIQTLKYFIWEAETTGKIMELKQEDISDNPKTKNGSSIEKKNPQVETVHEALPQIQKIDTQSDSK